MSEANVEMEDAENHPSEKSSVQENQEDVFILDAAAGNAIPLNDSCEASSSEPSVLVNAIKTLQQNQEVLASRLDKHDEAHEEVITFKKKRSDNTSEIQDLLAK